MAISLWHRMAVAVREGLVTATVSRNGHVVRFVLLLFQLPGVNSAPQRCWLPGIIFGREENGIVHRDGVC